MHIEDPPPIPVVPVPEAWVSILAAPAATVVQGAALVLTARGMENRAHRVDGTWHLLVRERDITAARHELAEYHAENRPRPVHRSAALQTGNGWWAVAAFLIVIWVIPWIETRFITTSLRDAGAFDVAAFRGGAWWLPVTALTLHADLAHIAANSLFGGLFGYLLGRWLGAGVGWLLTLLAAVAANMSHGFIQADGFRSLGASTAVFAALGLTGVFAWRRGAFASDDRRRRFAPAFAAIAMIALTGTGGENTDLFGHLFGFAYGCLAGAVAAWWTGRDPDSTRSLITQWLSGAAALAIIGAAWLHAL